MTDSQNLLAEYAQAGSEVAFRELVSRYVDLVHSTALRLVGKDAHRAEDVAQTVFLDLARLARTLPSDVLLGGWLHRHTCFVAAKTMRSERRRELREKQAVEMKVLHNDSPGDFSHIAPVLDEAINELDEADRTAVLLRFFEQRDFRAVGEALGSNEDAARMRVSRALDKLQSLLKRRGVTTTSGGAFSALLFAHAVQAAPVGLAITISSAATLAGTSLATAATAAATKTLVMTTLQKSLITATVVILAGAGVYEAWQVAQLRGQTRMLQQQQASFAEQIEQLQGERDEARNQLAALRKEKERASDDTAELLRLRGMAGVARRASQEAEALRAQLAEQSSQAAESPVAGAMADAMKQAMEQRVEGRLSRMTARLHLTAEQARAARDILMRQARAMAAGVQQGISGKYDKAELARLTQEAGNPDEQLKALLTPEQQAAFPGCQQEEAAHDASLAANSELLQLQSTLGLAAEQLDPVYAALYDLNFSQLTGKAKPDVVNQGEAMQWALDQKAKALEPLLTETQLESYRRQQALQAKLVKDIMTRMEGSGGAKEPAGP